MLAYETAYKIWAKIYRVKVGTKVIPQNFWYRHESGLHYLTSLDVMRHDIGLVQEVQELGRLDQFTLVSSHDSTYYYWPFFTLKVVK